MPCRRNIFSPSDPRAGDPDSPAHQRCGHIPSPSSRAPSLPPRLRARRKLEDGQDTAGVWSRRTSGPPVSGTNPGWYPAWQCRQPLGAPFNPGVCRFRPAWRAHHRLGANAQAASLSKPDSLRPGISSAEEVPGSRHRSHTLAVVAICDSSSCSSILLTGGPFEFFYHTG